MLLADGGGNGCVALGGVGGVGWLVERKSFLTCSALPEGAGGYECFCACCRNDRLSAAKCTHCDCPPRPSLRGCLRNYALEHDDALSASPLHTHTHTRYKHRPLFMHAAQMQTRFATPAYGRTPAFALHERVNT